MVAAYHLIWTAYGWWLPNDPRGSNSREIRVERIAELGDLHYGRKEEQPSRDELREFYQRAIPILAHSVLTFDEEEVAVLAESFARTIEERGYICHACAVMPEHVHLLICRHRDTAEKMIDVFQEESRTAILEARRRPGNHPVWGGRGYKVFQNTQIDIRRTIIYIEKNPEERNLPRQFWDFVLPYDGWLPTHHQ